MEIRISGRHVDVGDAFRIHAEDRLGAITEKYFSHAVGSHITLGHGAHNRSFHVDCTMHVMQGVILKAEAEAADAHAALDAAANRIEKQLRRYKRRLKNHHAEPMKEISISPANVRIVEADQDEDEQETGTNPVIIAETKVDIPSVSVADAVMLMDLAHAPAMMFRDVVTGQFAMIYRRSDGHIGWVEPGISG